MYLLTEWQSRTGNIWLEVMAYGPRAARSLNIFEKLAFIVFGTLLSYKFCFTHNLLALPILNLFIFLVRAYNTSYPLSV